jgi:RNA ligase (TIGR02306 family)
VAAHYGLAERLRDYPGIAFYGEVYGWLQDLRYGHTQGKASLVLFDIMDLTNRHWLDYDDFVALAKKLDIPTVPVLYRGPWSKEVLKHAEGNTLLGGDHVREGTVIRPVKERFDERVGRVILKFHSEAYLLRK